MGPNGDPPKPDDENDIDGCACGAGIPSGEAVPDSDLPAATGGVAVLAKPGADEDHVDGCLIGAQHGDITSDEDLPASSGGVAWHSH
jgi:hypothetical protein